MERNELLDKFFELKCKQMLCKLWLMAFAKPGYVNDEIGLCMKHMEVQSKLENLEDEMMKFLVTNRDELLNKYSKEDLDAYCQEYKISLERQKELAKEVLGKEWTIEELLERVDQR